MDYGVFVGDENEGEEMEEENEVKERREKNGKGLEDKEWRKWRWGLEKKYYTDKKRNNKNRGIENEWK